ncbi:hypothetical protein C1H46_036106 [Malus baccata]|uniref:Uncharacterized protein n=1 Tax=Malus baccata TaxID=106549 RepID=A0A540KVX0_MALBA|nr:hypothetical protein C1H46_036106 [Malus baccata]
MEKTEKVGRWFWLRVSIMVGYIVNFERRCMLLSIGGSYYQFTTVISVKHYFLANFIS